MEWIGMDWIDPGWIDADGAGEYSSTLCCAQPELSCSVGTLPICSVTWDSLEAPTRPRQLMPAEWAGFKCISTFSLSNEEYASLFNLYGRSNSHGEVG